MVLLFFSTQELIMVGIIAVLLFGSKKIPELARGVGKGIREFKNATSDIQEEIRKTTNEINEQADVTKKKPKENSNKPDQN
ncbi:MAG: twin-arginine translocase TatA/TatE family subunit [Verrucomicrobia bacterium]|nr:twin-arginine translocase TatA/TatE family subunit [Verrucomicrobiota bacterium]